MDIQQISQSLDVVQKQTAMALRRSATSGNTYNNPTFTGTITDNATAVLWQEVGNNSYVRSLLFPDFTAPDGSSHQAFAIPIPAHVGSAGDQGTRFDFVLQGKNPATGDMWSGTYRVKVMRVTGGSPSITTVANTQVEVDNTGGASGWTVTVAVGSPGSPFVTVTITSVTGAVWQCVPQLTSV